MGKAAPMEKFSGDDGSPVSPVYAYVPQYDDSLERGTDKGLRLFVIFTDMAGTLAALQMAEGLAQRLESHIRLLMLYEVTYALPLTRPAVPVGFLERQVRDVAAMFQGEIAAEIYLCRDKILTLKSLLRPESLVLVGGKRRYWPNSSLRLARALQKSGYQVIFAEVR